MGIFAFTYLFNSHRDILVLNILCINKAKQLPDYRVGLVCFIILSSASGMWMFKICLLINVSEFKLYKNYDTLWSLTIKA